MALNILKYIYNLILTTLGIDNPFIIERTNEPTTSVTRTETIKHTNSTLTQTTSYKGGKR